MTENLTRRRYRRRWDRYMTRCATVSGGWQHHKVLSGWARREEASPAVYWRRERLYEALTALTCAYYTRGLKCSTGWCWTEPRCITDAPADGWRLWGQK